MQRPSSRINILYIANRYYPPQQNGGAQISMHEILKRLPSDHYHCEAIVQCMPGIRHFLSRVLYLLSGKTISGWSDKSNGYPTFRTASWHIYAMAERRIRKRTPNILLFDDVKLAQEWRKKYPRYNIPIILSLVEVLFMDHQSPDWDTSIIAYSNSQFTAQRVRDRLSKETPVIYPIVDFQNYKTQRTKPWAITLINPTILKGLDLVLDIARRLPEREFLFVEGWFDKNNHAELRNKLRDLPNVTLHPWTQDMRNIYNQTILLLIPTQCEESFGRVALEAHANGIPVIAKRKGGLPESVGEGGILIDDNATAEQWVECIKQMLVDDNNYQRYSTQAFKNTQKFMFSTKKLMKDFENLLKDVVKISHESA